jgi:hypothetical protein
MSNKHTTTTTPPAAHLAPDHPCPCWPLARHAAPLCYIAEPTKEQYGFDAEAEARRRMRVGGKKSPHLVLNPYDPKTDAFLLFDNELMNSSDRDTAREGEAAYKKAKHYTECPYSMRRQPGFATLWLGGWHLAELEHQTIREKARSATTAQPAKK